MEQYNNAFLLLLSFIGLIWMIKGMKKTLRLMVFFGVILILAPILIMMGRMTWLPFISSVAFGASLLVRKEGNKGRMDDPVDERNV